MTNNHAYWRNRANRRMDEYLNIADSATQELAKAYAQATAYLADEAKRTFSNFALGIPEQEARRLLSTIDTADTTAQVKLMLASVTNPALKRALEKQLAAPAYRARLLRLKSLQEQVDQTVQKLGGIELQTTTQGYVDTATHAYYRTAYDTQKAVGVFDFAQLQQGRIEEITAQNWSGKHYSERIWGNMGKLADELQQELVLGFATGRSSGKMARVMADKFDVAYWKAARLARTETNYVANQAEMETYKACGFERYKFLAKLDSRTSKLCQKQDGKEYAVEDAQAGVNLPPLHPYCRSTTVPVIPGASIGRRIAMGEDGKSIKVPANMTYAEWREKYVDNKGESGIIEVRGGDVQINGIEIPIEQRNTAKGNPNAILQFDRPLNNRQQRIIDKLPVFDSRTIVAKRDVSMKDLAALTAFSGDEFALFTKRGERLIIRGNSTMVNIDTDKAASLASDGYRWSGHTHPGITVFSLTPSDGDREILKYCNNFQSTIYNSSGKWVRFDKEGML